MVYSAFQAAPDTVVTGFGYYYFYGAPSEYASTNWSIWQDTGSDTKQLVASGSGAGAAVGTVLSTDPTLVEVGGLDVTLQSGGEYWIGIQNNLTAGSGDYTLYAVTSAETANTYVTRDVAASGEGLTFGADRTAFYQHAFYIDSEVVQGRTGGPLQPEPVSAPELSTWAMMLTGGPSSPQAMPPYNPLRDQTRARCRDDSPAAATTQFVQRLESALMGGSQQGHADRVASSYGPAAVSRFPTRNRNSCPSRCRRPEARPVANVARGAARMAMMQPNMRGPVAPNGAPLPMYRAAASQAGVRRPATTSLVCPTMLGQAMRLTQTTPPSLIRSSIRQRLAVHRPVLSVSPGSAWMAEGDLGMG